MSDIAKFAKEHNVDELSLKNFTAYFIGKVQSNEDLKAWFFRDPHLVIEHGLKVWLKHSREFYKKLEDPNSEEYKMLVSKLAKK